MTTPHEALREAVEALKEMIAWANCKPGTYPGGYPGTKAASAIAKAEEALKQPEASEFKGWYCAHCQRGVDGSEVTFHELHTVCGRVITDDVPPSPSKPEAAGVPDVLTGKQRLYLAQAWAMLEDYAQDQRSKGNDSFADGAEASAHEIKAMLAAPQPPEQPATEYEKQNPLGGPAKVFDAMADAIRAGDSYESVLKLYGYAETKANHPEQHLEMVSGDHSGDTNEMVAANAAPQPICQTCNGNGLIGGPSFYAPDEGGVPCLDCSTAPKA